jgi:hypothetical protein
MKKLELKQIIKEEVSNVLNELQPTTNNPYFVLGFSVGPNSKQGIDPNSKEAKYIMSRAKGSFTLDELTGDKNLVEFTKGFIASIGSSQAKYEGAPSVVRLLIRVAKDGWPKPGYVL